MKQCAKCGDSLPESEFYANPNTRDKLRGECIPCVKEYMARRRSGEPPGYTRTVRTLRSRGCYHYLVAIPPAIYDKMGRPSAIRWTDTDGEIGMELID